MAPRWQFMRTGAATPDARQVGRRALESTVTGPGSHAALFQSLRCLAKAFCDIQVIWPPQSLIGRNPRTPPMRRRDHIRRIVRIVEPLWARIIELVDVRVWSFFAVPSSRTTGRTGCPEPAPTSRSPLR